MTDKNRLLSKSALNFKSEIELVVGNIIAHKNPPKQWWVLLRGEGREEALTCMPYLKIKAGFSRRGVIHEPPRLESKAMGNGRSQKATTPRGMESGVANRPCVPDHGEIGPSTRPPLFRIRLPSRTLVDKPSERIGLPGTTRFNDNESSKLVALIRSFELFI